VRTLFVGAGATGGYFGGRLAEAGKDITFLVRPGRRAVLERGLRIKGPGGETVSHPKLITADAVDGPYDLVVLAVKSYALEQALIDMTPAIGPRTVIVPLLNGMRHLDVLTGAFGVERTWGGVCLIEATIDQDGDVEQLSALHRIGYGPLDGSEDERLPEVTFALSGEEFDSNPSHTIVEDMWGKWVYLAAAAGLTTLMRATVGDVNAAPGGPDLAARMAGEAVAIATAAGHQPRPAAVEVVRQNLATTAPRSSSMYRDMTQGLPVEADAILGDLLAEAAEHDVPAPMLAAAYTNLCIYAAKRAG
jgi:2-dehydropantoate 2-reductase